MKIASYIIPFNSKIDDIHSLRKVLQWLSSFKNIEVIIVEYNSKSSILDQLSNPFVYIPVKSEKLVFSASWAYNIGIKRSNSDIVICGDSSILTNPKNIQKSIELIKSGYQMVKPFNRRVEVKSSELNNFDSMDKNTSSPLMGDNDDNYEHLCSGIGVYDRPSLLKIGGWEEKFKMECFVDFQSHKIKNILKYKELDGSGYSLYSRNPHNTQVVSSDINLNNKLKTLNSEELVNYINSTYSNIGMVNKFS